MNRAQFVLLPALAAAVAFAAPLPLPVSARGDWTATFDAASSTLACEHAATKTRLAGRLSFAASLHGGPVAAWTVQASRDFVADRLTLVDPQNEVRGYLRILADGNRLNISVVPRPNNSYTGELRFTPEIRLGPHAFACRTHIPESDQVVQIASGSADSLLNDSVFDPERDLAVAFGARRVSVTTQLPGPAFRAELEAAVKNGAPAAAPITLEVTPDYYRARYVPAYRLIDRKRAPVAPTGWMSWNAYFDRAGEDDNLENARTAAKYFKRYGLDIISIESWQENSPKLPVSSFHNLTLKPSPEKFPHGMKWLAGQIRELGFRPGIWTVPFGTGDASFYESHREWFLHDSKGQPMRNWTGRYVLDLSQAAVRRHMEETHRTMSADWGYEFFKIDGMSGGNRSYSAHFFEQPDVRAALREKCDDPYRLAVEALRRGIGKDRIFLACGGHYTGPEVAWLDAARLGADLVKPNEPPHWENYVSQARSTLAALFINNIVWYNDPDTLMVGLPASLPVARVAATVVALPGQLTFFGDKLPELPPERIRLLQQVLPVADVRPLDLAPIAELKPYWDLKVQRPFGKWDVVSVFNWGDEPRNMRLPFSALGLEPAKQYVMWEFWSHRLAGIQSGSLDVRVEPRSNLLLAVHELLNRPQVLSTDRHVAQGAVELADVAWEGNRAALACTLKMVAGDPITVFVHVPLGYKLGQLAASGATVESKAEADSVASVVLRAAAAGQARLTLEFAREPMAAEGTAR